ncbi:MAG: KilA-N domain-containing protein [Magnetococcales bacterium]|nr:KilA-N domain-containing protein [Magnetococcales bacterium]
MIVSASYQGLEVTFNEDGWFNATLVAERFGKEVYSWLRQRDTVEYMTVLAVDLGKINSDSVEEMNIIKQLESTSAASQAKLLTLAKKTGLVRTKSGPLENGGGTWLHSKLAVVFARWLDIRFAVWCDLQIDKILSGSHPHFDWKKSRHAAASSFKVMSEALRIVREEQGKIAASHHYINEARLVNWAISGEFKGMDRESLSSNELDLLAKLEVRNSVLLGRGLAYTDRKQMLEQFVVDHKTPIRQIA